jgi:hypothetical protein
MNIMLNIVMASVVKVSILSEMALTLCINPSISPSQQVQRGHHVEHCDGKHDGAHPV